MEKRILKLRTIDQLVLWKNELTGQLSDGKWENARPHNHCKEWCDCTVEVDPVQQGTSWWPHKTNYNFLDPMLLDILAERMRLYVVIGRCYGHDKVELLEYLFETGAAADVTQARSEPKADQWPAMHFKQAREAGFDPNEVQGKVLGAMHMYNLKQLKKDLKEIKQAIKTQL
jgi:hypothetical protein